VARPKQAFCKRGHPMSGDNLRITTGGIRQCKACNLIAQSAYRKNDKGNDACKRRDLKTVCWTLERFKDALISQNNACAICKTSFSSFPKSPFADHDHLERKPRALLCSACNSGLGLFKDSPALLEYAAEYLRKYGK